MPSTLQEFLDRAENEICKKKKIDEDLNEKRYPPKATDYNKVTNPDGFWSLPLQDAKMLSGATHERAQDIGGLIMFLNMVAVGWERNKGKRPKQ